jgi:DNA-binding CsgD family transcriptional regulator
MLTHLLGAEPEPPTVDAVNERAQGNPFFIEQFASSGDPRCGDIPNSLRDLLLSRVDLLPEPAQRVLRVAAVGGTKFGHELLSRVAGVDEASLESALRTIVATQLIVFDPDGGYEFRHALVREAVHDDLLPGEHARLHARYAQAVESEPHLVAMGRAPAEIAHHWHAAHDHPRALVSAKRAADEAARRFAYGEQARLLDRVIELWEDVPQAAELLGIDHLDLLEETALVAIDSGDHMRALSLTRAALCDLDAEAEPLRAARLLVRRAKLLRNAGKSDGRSETFEAYRLLSLAEPGADRVRLLADVAYVMASIDAVRAGVVAQEAMAEATRIGDLSTLVNAEITFARVCAGQMPPTEGLPTMRAAADRAREAGDLSALTRALVNISDSEFELGHYAQSAEAAGEGVPHADRVGVGRTTGVFLLANHAEALMALGRWDEADARLAEAARLDPPGKLALPWLRLRSMLRLARGHEGASALLARAVGLLGRPFLHSEERFCLHELRILQALAAGDSAAAAAAARAAAAEPGLAERPRYAWAMLTAAARAADDDLRPVLRDAAAGIPHLYPAEQAQALTLAALLNGGETCWAAAVEAWRRDGQHYELARALLSLAEARAADRPAAASALSEAVAVAGALGARPLLDAADTLGRRLGLRPTSVVAGPDILTAREREVLRLVAEGQSNSRIAQSLYISPKTASVHVSRIIAKLEVANRVEAAAVAHRLGLLAD